MKNDFESTKLATIMLLVILYPYHMCTGVGFRRLWHQIFGTIVFPCKRTNLLRVRRNISTVKHFSNYLFHFWITLNLVHPRGILFGYFFTCNKPLFTASENFKVVISAAKNKQCVGTDSWNKICKHLGWTPLVNLPDTNALLAYGRNKCHIWLFDLNQKEVSCQICIIFFVCPKGHKAIQCGICSANVLFICTNKVFLQLPIPTGIPGL